MWEGKGSRADARAASVVVFIGGVEVTKRSASADQFG